MPFGASRMAAPGDVDPSANPGAINPCNARPGDGSLYSPNQEMSFSNALYHDSHVVPFNGWGDVGVVPSLTIFAGNMSGEWLAIGVEEESDLTRFCETGGQ